MKTRVIFLGAILTILSLPLHAQVYEMLYQGFETGETQRYTTSTQNGASVSELVYSSGAKSLEILQNREGEVELILDTLDFTQNLALRYISFQFDHICHVPVNSSTSISMGTIYYKRANQTDAQWTQLTRQEYNRTSGSYSMEFYRTGAFHSECYTEWYNTSETVTNSMWKSERFDLDNVLTSSLAANERKLLIKFVLKRRTPTGNPDPNKIGWWLDNIKIRASSARMITPTINMVRYPHLMAYPNSRGARIALDASTSSAVTEGINPDSVFLYYTVGSDPTVTRVNMTHGTGNRFNATIPFMGYDTLMRFYCVAHDATSNANRVTFPAADGAWVDFRFVRGVAQPGVMTTGFTPAGNEQWFPFPGDADHKCEIVYDSALMADAGYGPGAITSLRFTVGANTQGIDHPRLALRMRNVGTDHNVDPSAYSWLYTSGFLHTVYDSAFQMPAVSAGVEQTIQFQDTFYYAGKDMVVQLIYDDNEDKSATTIKTLQETLTPNNKKTIYSYNGSAIYNYDPFSSSDFDRAQNSSKKRPAFIFYQHANQPLLYDAGVSELVDPNYTQPMTVRPGSITVRLKNFGSLPLNAVRITYNIDDTIQSYYDWTGNLAGSDVLLGGADELVTISTNINIPAGFHRLKVWVEDTVTSNGNHYRDHEPMNDTSFSEFIVCDGSLSGVRNIGGDNPHFNTIEEFLFSLSRCGIDDSLVVRLAPGLYPAFTMPAVNGLSNEHYIVFESMDEDRAELFFDAATSQTSIVNVEAVDNIRFRNLDFVRRSGTPEVMVKLATTSVNCHFEGCKFIDSVENPSAEMRIEHMLCNYYANNMAVDGCTFIGAKMGVDIQGQASDIRSSGSSVRNSIFRNQYNNAVKVENQTDIAVDGNEMYDVLGNSGYVLQMIECYGNVSMQRNKIYTTHGAGGVGVSNLIGTASSPAVVANNMIVCEDDGQSNLMRTALNIIQGDYIDVVYNSVKLNAPQRNNVAAVTFGGGALTNSRFVNNIIVTLDESNYALSYQSFNTSTNTVANNVYYVNGAVLNRRGSSSYSTLAAWKLIEVGDSLSVSANPNFINSTLVDLRTYSRLVQGKGTHIASVTTDFYGTERDASAPCPGAFEFLPLLYDFNSEAMVSPMASDCYMPDSVEMRLLLRNEGISSYIPNTDNPFLISYQVNGGTVQTDTLRQTLPAEDTVTAATGIMLHLPANGLNDSTYQIKVWFDFASDPNKTNDTSTFTVISRYHPAAPGHDTVEVDYNHTVQITPTVGVNQWAVYNDNSAPLRGSQIYWYRDSTDSEPFHVGRSYTTDTIREDVDYYIMQRRETPIVRFTQIEIAHAAASVGKTNPMPYWMTDARKVAIQLTNVGDATAYLQGDTLQSVSKTAGLNSVYVMPNVKIEPGQSLVIQYAKVTNNPATDSSVTIRTQTASNTAVTPSFAHNSNMGFVYRRGGVIEDAVAFNTVITDGTAWTSLNVPSYVWNGDAITFVNNVSGVVRTAFDGGASDWTRSTAAAPMFLDATDDSWIRYIDNGCLGEKAPMTVKVLNPPTEDLALTSLILPESGCGLDSESIAVMVHNFGTDTVQQYELCYTTGGQDTVRETITGGLLSHHDTVVTFATSVDMAFAHDSTLSFTVWVSPHPGDPISENDTLRGSVTSLYTPHAPDSIDDRMVQYATADTLSVPFDSTYVPIWYDFSLNPVDTSFRYVTDILYGGGTMGLSFLALKSSEHQIGFSTTTNGNNALPSPYQPSAKFVKQQYIYSAYDLQEAGVVPGTLKSLSFFLDTIKVNSDTVRLYNYSIAMGHTEDTFFVNASSWKDASQVVWSRDTVALARANAHLWIEHWFDTAFVWDGVSNVVVQVTYTLPAVVSASNKDVKTFCTSKNKSVLHKGASSAITPTTSGTVAANRPNIKFNVISYGCSGPISQFNVQLTGVPTIDAAVLGFGDSLVYNSCDSIEIPVVVRNQGQTTVDTVMFRYWLDDHEVDSTIHAVNILGGTLDTLSIFRESIAPGRHTVTAALHVAGDSINTNDTIRGSFIVRFCGGDYTVSPDSTGDFLSLGQVADSLNAVGIAGPVNIHIASGTYNEQVALTNVPGTSLANSISFIGIDTVIISDTTSEQVNYVMSVDGVANFRLSNVTMNSVPVKGTSTNTTKNQYFGHVLVLQNIEKATINGNKFSVSHVTAANEKTENSFFSNIALRGNVSHLSITNCVIDSGAYAIKSYGSVNNYSSVLIANDTIKNFASGGIDMRGISNLNIHHNDIRSGNSSDSRGLIGIYLAQTTGTFRVECNKIYLLSANKGAKRGMQLEQIVATGANPAFVDNNMISTTSTDSKGLPDHYLTATTKKTVSAGIILDSSSAYVNVLFNSIRVQGTNATSSVNDLTLAFFCGATGSNNQVMNNVFSNFSRGYAYYVGSTNAVATSNYNGYYTGAPNAFMWGTTNCPLLTNLQNANSDDGNSVMDEPFFIANDDLHMLMTNFFGLGSHTYDVPTDIDGKVREQIPGPTLGAHEIDRPTHDISVVRIHEPLVPANPVDVETDSVRVVASFYNNGRSNEPTVTWYAYIDGHEEDTRSVNRTFSNFSPSQMRTDTVMIPTVLGIIDTQTVRVVVLLNNDASPENNELTTPVYLSPAFNLKAEKVEVVNPATPRGCFMQNSQIKLTLRNVGKKPFPAGAQLKIGYHTHVKTPANLSFATMPDTVEQIVQLPNMLAINSTVDFTFDSIANLYPTDTALNIKVQFKGWCTYQHDITRNNDTTSYAERDSYYTPAPPVGHSVYLPYGTWGTVTAEQENSLKIRWFKDSTTSAFYSPNTYAKSCVWNGSPQTPQCFNDTVYYLNCLSDKNCPSYFDTVWIHVNPRIPNDMAFEEVLAPLGGRVYMENDTVRVRIANYGTATQSNFPICYRLMQGNNELQTVTETVTASVAPGQSYVYTFDTLLAIPTPTASKTYTLTVWTDLATDGTRRNDTIRTNHTFSSLPESRYTSNYKYKPSASDTKFDITSVSWNGIDLEMPVFNRTVTDLAKYANPDYPALHVYRGTTDSIFIKVTPIEEDGQQFRCRAYVQIDFNRNGIVHDQTTGDNNECLVDAAPFYSDSTFTAPITIPQCASLGYMRMRVIVKGYDAESKEGHVIDFLLFVDEERPQKDVAISNIVSPRSFHISDATPQKVSFRMLNRGSTAVNSLDINYCFVSAETGTGDTGVVHWTGNLASGHSTVVELPAHRFEMGVSHLHIWHNMEGDADANNNALPNPYEFNRFHTVYLTVNDDFEGADLWYAPTGYNVYSRNYWHRGTPNKTRLNGAYSGENAWWIDDLTGSTNINPNGKGNVSYLYSPIIDIAQIHADTISFRLRRDLKNDSRMHIEFYNFEGKWVKLDYDSALVWYNNDDERAFTGTSSNSENYKRYYLSTVSSRVNGDFNEKLQLRFVYYAPLKSGNFGEGCAVDDFHFGRSRIPTETGVIDITEPSAPRYGQTIYPEVVIKNYGTDTLRSVTIGYSHYSSLMAKYSTFNGLALAPNKTDTLRLTTPFVITSDYPDTFFIQAFTSVMEDLYLDNDTCFKLIPIHPLDNDISAVSFITPLDRVIAGDTNVAVTMRVHNFGVNSIASATMTYIVNSGQPVTEEVDFVSLLGHELQFNEYFNYTFHQRIHASMGIMRLVGYVKSEQNEYIYNDTISKHFQGITSITDLAAAAVIVDTSALSFIRIGMVIDNRGARGANNFEVGYWIDNDTSTMVRETYSRYLPLPALTTGYYLFDSILPARTAPYNFISAYVKIANDNDPSNDTTDARTEQYTDIEVTKVLVEENASNDCRVFVQLTNVGNLALVDKQLRLRASINGNELSLNVRRRVNPGEVVYIEFDRTIPKSPIRQYVGSGRVMEIPGDNNNENNQTSIIEVINYMEGIPSVAAEQLVLDQNYPNPFSHTTVVNYSLPSASDVRFFIIDATGHIVHQDSRFEQAGPHSRTLDLSAYPAGVYFYGIVVNGQRLMRKMILQ